MINSKITTRAILVFTLSFYSLMPGATTAGTDEAVISQGKELAFNRKMGNCLACHMIAGGSLPGNIGPPLIAMKARFPDASVLRARIWDASENNPSSIMPPFGRHQILSEDEIDKIVAFIYTL
ncbi:MAG: sulfur oxidation c-type cytochrome SoxX [Anaerolineae bacterium]|nr:sulfur oxidation c-type cytochrome SoxX [Anaerolineae bacterium]